MLEAPRAVIISMRLEGARSSCELWDLKVLHAAQRDGLLESLGLYAFWPIRSLDELRGGECLLSLENSLIVS